MYGPEINRSYFFAIDTRCGWGNTSFFTYFSEFDRSSRYDAYIEAAFLTTLFVLALIGNTCTICVIVCNSSLRTITNYFVCNLALADILLVTSGPFIAHVRIKETWTLGDGMCSYLSYAMFVCGAVMIWTMAVISIDRFICINLNVASSRRLKNKHIAGICVLIWTLSFASFSPLAIYFNTVTVQRDTDTVSFCSLLWPRANVSFSAIFTISVGIVGFVIPFIIIIVNYTRIFKKLRTASRAIAHASQEASYPARTGSVRRRNVQVINTLVLLVVLFFLMLTPLFIIFFLIQQDATNESFVVPSHALIWVIVVCFANAFINPFLYGYLNNRLKRRLASVCKWRRRKKVSHGNNNITRNNISSLADRHF